MIITMALADPAHDPVDHDVELIFGDPDILTSLEEFERDLENGDLKVVSDDEARPQLAYPGFLTSTIPVEVGVAPAGNRRSCAGRGVVRTASGGGVRRDEPHGAGGLVPRACYAMAAPSVLDS